MDKAAVAGLIAACLVIFGGIARFLLRAGDRVDLKGLAMGLVLAGLGVGLLALVLVWASNMD